MSKSIIADLKSDLLAFADPKRAEKSKSFFKTGPGEYGEGDVFIGVSVPDQRKVAKKYRTISLRDIDLLLQSKIHEHRLIALLILVAQFEQNNDHSATQKEIVDFYISHLDRVNNWDLVDSTAHKILGPWIIAHPQEKDILNTLADSGDLWRERVSVIATFAFIARNDFKDSLLLAKRFLTHPHDLIHKAVGWMLREIGKKDIGALIVFLDLHYHEMPRTMLRYAIEKIDEPLRKSYLLGTRKTY